MKIQIKTLQIFTKIKKLLLHFGPRHLAARKVLIKEKNVIKIPIKVQVYLKNNLLNQSKLRRIVVKLRPFFRKHFEKIQVGFVVLVLTSPTKGLSMLLLKKGILFSVLKKHSNAFSVLVRFMIAPMDPSSYSEILLTKTDILQLEYLLELNSSAKEELKYVREILLSKLSEKFTESQIEEYLDSISKKGMDYLNKLKEVRENRLALSTDLTEVPSNEKELDLSPLASLLPLETSDSMAKTTFEEALEKAKALSLEESKPISGSLSNQNAGPNEVDWLGYNSDDERKERKALIRKWQDEVFWPSIPDDQENLNELVRVPNPETQVKEPNNKESK